MNLSYKRMSSPVGGLKLVASDKGLVAVLWEDHPFRIRLGKVVTDNSNPILNQAEKQLNQYFAGTRTSFSVSIDLRGTPFQIHVWEALLAIRFGQTKTYGEVAKQLGNPQAARAVGSATGRNPISIIVPCHRVIGSTGKLTGFAGGLQAKAHLLELEREQSKGSQAIPVLKGDRSALIQGNRLSMRTPLGSVRPASRECKGLLRRETEPSATGHNSPTASRS